MISDSAFCVCLDIVVFFEMGAERVGLVPSAVTDVVVATAITAVPDFRGNAMFDNFVVCPVLVSGKRFVADSVRGRFSSCRRKWSFLRLSDGRD
jgi:hypothetical protein